MKDNDVNGMIDPDENPSVGAAVAIAALVVCRGACRALRDMSFMI